MTGPQLTFAAGFLLLLSGFLAFLVPATLWRAATRPRSRLSHQASVAALLLFGGLGWLGLCFVAFNAADLARGHLSTSWPETPAVVRESSLVAVSWFRSASPVYRPHVAYAYTVADREHVSTRLAFGSRPWPGREAAEAELAQRYAPGAPLVVRVNPVNPADAVLSPGLSSLAAIQAALGLAFIGVSIWQLRSLLRDWTGEKSAAPAKPRRRR